MSKNIAIVTQDDPFYMPLFFEEFFSFIGKEVSIKNVTILDMMDEDFYSFIKRMYRFYGLENFCRRGLDYVYRKGANVIGVGEYSVRSVVTANDVPVETRNNVNSDQYIDWIEAANIDIVLSVSAPQIFDERLLDKPNWGCINVHTADLPKYRGMLPTFWALYHDEDEIGITVHTMESKIDSGQVVTQSRFSIDQSTTLDEAIKCGKRVGGQMAAEAVNDISTGDALLREMEGEGSYFSFPTVDDRQEFQRRGGKLL